MAEARGHLQGPDAWIGSPEIAYDLEGFVRTLVDDDEDITLVLVLQGFEDSHESVTKLGNHGLFIIGWSDYRQSFLHGRAFRGSAPGVEQALLGVVQANGIAVALFGHVVISQNLALPEAAFFGRGAAGMKENLHAGAGLGRL